MLRKLVLAGAIALAAVTPASAHGFGLSFNFGIPFPAPYYYAPPVVLAPPAPPVYFYPPGAPTRFTGEWPVQPDAVVRRAQYALNMLGYGPLEVDGVEGPATYNAIGAFQANNGLAVDGIPGMATMAVIDHQVALRLPPPPRAAPPPVEHGDDKSPATAAPTVHQS